MRLPYTIVCYVLHLFVLPYFLAKAKLRAGFWQRFWWRREKPWRGTKAGNPETCVLWLHGASAGDVLCLKPIVSALQEKNHWQPVLTTTTITGMSMAESHFPEARLAYQPFELPGACRRAAQSIHARLLILERCELWPAMIFEAVRCGTKVAVVNAHLSPDSVKAYQRLQVLSGPFLKKISLFCVRDEEEAERLRLLNVPQEKIRLCGNSKWDLLKQGPAAQDIDTMRQQMRLEQGTAVWVAGSTHQGEENILMDVFQKLLVDTPDLHLVIAPRYLERVGEIEALARRHGLTFARRSLLNSGSQQRQLTLLDTMGELHRVYGLAQFAFVGGTLVSRGGQNMLEPASLGVPVVVGPHSQNDMDQIKLLKGHGLHQVNTHHELVPLIQRWLSHPEELDELGRMARLRVQKGQGASARIAEAVTEILDDEG